MAGPARTRGRYVDLETTANGRRSARLQREAIRRWSQWPAVEKRALITHLDAHEAAERQRDAALGAVVEHEASLAYATTMGLRLLPARTAVHNAHRTVEDAQRAVRDEANWIHNFYQMHSCSQALTLAAADDLAGATQRLATVGASTIAARQQLARPEPQYRKVSTAGFPLQQTDTLCGMHLEKFEDHFVVDEAVPRQVGEWHGPYHISYNHETLITAWVLRGEDEEILDTVVRKDIDCHSGWDSIRWWPDVTNFAHRLHAELVVHQALQSVSTSSITGWSNILRLHTSGVNRRTRTCTAYLELAQYGTLKEVIDGYRACEKWIPEAFIWYVFLVLAECAVAMQTGHTPTEDQPAAIIDGWQEIVHFDIKPDNLFLTAPNPDRFADYPAPKLGDFDGSFRTHDADPMNPALFANNGGTTKFRAPEQRLYWDERTQHPVDRYKLGAHTNIYAIGLTIRDLMVREGNGTLNEPVGDTEHDIWPVIAHRHMDTWSRPLFNLVDRCLRYTPDQRITPGELLTAVLDHLTDRTGLQLACDLYSGRATAQELASNSIYRDVKEDDPRDLRPERGGDARFKIGLPVPGEVNKGLRTMTSDNRLAVNEKVGVRASWHRALRER